jgi:hypothetical protein
MFVQVPGVLTDITDCFQNVFSDLEYDFLGTCLAEESWDGTIGFKSVLHKHVVGTILFQMFTWK